MKKLILVVLLLAFVSLASAETPVDCFVQGITCPVQCRDSAGRDYNTRVGANPCALTGSGSNYCYIKTPVACGTNPYNYSKDGKCATLAEAGAGWTNFTGTPEFACGVTGTTPKYCYAVPCSAQGSGDGQCLTGPTDAYPYKAGAYTCDFWSEHKTKYCYEAPNFQDCSVYDDCETNDNPVGCLCIDEYNPGYGSHWGRDQCDQVSKTLPCRSGEAGSMCVDPKLWGEYGHGGTISNTCTWSMITGTAPSPLTGAGSVTVTVQYAHFDISTYSSIPELSFQCDSRVSWSAWESIGDKHDGEVTFDCEYGAVTFNTQHEITYEFRQQLRPGYAIKEWSAGVTVNQLPGDDFYAACTTYPLCNDKICSCAEQDYAHPPGAYCVPVGGGVNCRQGVDTKCVKSQRDIANDWSCPQLEITSLTQTGANEITVEFDYDGTDYSSQSSSPKYRVRCDSHPYPFAPPGGITLGKGGGSASYTCVYSLPITEDEIREITVRVFQNLNVAGPDLLVTTDPENVIQHAQWSGGSGYSDCVALHPQWGYWLPCISHDHEWVDKYFEFIPSEECEEGKYCFEPKSCAGQGLVNAACIVPGYQLPTYTRKSVKACDIVYGGDLTPPIPSGLYYAAYCYEQTSAPIPVNYASCDELFPEEAEDAETICLNPADTQANYYYLLGGVCGQDKTCYYTKSCYDQGYPGNVCAVPGQQPAGYQKHTKACDLVNGGLIGLDPNIDYRAYCYYQGSAPIPGAGSGSAMVEGVFITSPEDLKASYSVNGVLDLNLRIYPFWGSGSADLTCKYVLNWINQDGAEMEHSADYFELFHDGSGLEIYSLPSELTGLKDAWYDLKLSCKGKPAGIIENLLSAIPFIGEALVNKPASTAHSYFYHARNTALISQVGGCTDPDGKNEFKKGYCTESLSGAVVQHWDYCEPTISAIEKSMVLNEYLCSPGVFGQSAMIADHCNAVQVDCAYGCVDGACLLDSTQQTWCADFPVYSGPAPSPQATEEPELAFEPAELEGRTDSVINFGGHAYLVYQQAANKVWVRDTDSALSLELVKGAAYDAFFYEDHEVRLQLTGQAVDDNNLVSTLKFVYYTEDGAEVKPGSSNADTVTICLSVIAPLNGAVYYEEKVSLSYLIHPLDASGVPFEPPQGYEDWICYYELNSVPFMPPIYQSHDVKVEYGVTHSEVMEAGFGSKTVQVHCDPTNPPQELSYGLESDEVGFTVREAGFSVSLDEPQNETYALDLIPWEFTIECPPQSSISDAYLCQGELDGEFYELIRDNQVNYFYCGVPATGKFDLTGDYGQHYASVECAAESDPANFVKSNTVWFSNYPANVPVVLEPENKSYWSDEVDLSFIVDGTYEYYACAYGFDGNEYAFPLKDPDCLASNSIGCNLPAKDYFQAGEIYSFDGLLQVKPGQHEVFVSCAGLSPNEELVASKWLNSESVYFTSLDEGMPILYAPAEGDVYYYQTGGPGAEVTGVFEVGGFQGGSTDPVLFECYYSLNGVNHALGKVVGAVDPEFDMILTEGAYELNVSCELVTTLPVETRMTSNTAHFTVVKQVSPTPTPTATPTATPGPGGSGGGGGSGGSGGGFGSGSQGPGNATATPPAIPSLPPYSPSTPTPQAGQTGESYLNVNCPRSVTGGWNPMDAYLSFKGESKCDQSLAVTVTLDGEPVAGAGRLDSCSSGSHKVSFQVDEFGDYAVSIVSPAYGLSGNCVFKDGGLVAEEVPDLPLFAALLAALAAGYALSKRK